MGLVCFGETERAVIKSAHGGKHAIQVVKLLRDELE